MNQRHHAFVIEAETEAGIVVAQEWAKKELEIQIENNPDVAVLRYGLFSVADARKVTEIASGVPFVGDSKVVIISADRAYHEAQNALLKVFEEPPAGTYLFLILPTLGGLIPTLRSRVQVLNSSRDFVSPHLNVRLTRSNIPEVAEEFLKATKERRTALIKKLASGKDEEERRENRVKAIALINGIEVVIYRTTLESLTFQKHTELLSDIATLRTHLYDRSAPVKMILEHLSIVIPQDLL